MRIMGTLLAATRGDLGTQLRWRPCPVLEKLSSMSLAFTLVPIHILSSSTFYFNCFFFFLLFFFIAIRLKYGGNLQLVLNFLLGLFKKKKSDIYIYIYIGGGQEYLWPIETRTYSYVNMVRCLVKL